MVLLAPLKAFLVLTVILLQRVNVLVEVKLPHGLDYVLAVDGLPLLHLGDFAGLAGDEGNELRHTLLHALSRFLGYLRVVRQGLLHDPVDVGDGQKPLLVDYLFVHGVLVFALGVCAFHFFNIYNQVQGEITFLSWGFGVLGFWGFGFIFDLLILMTFFDSFLTHF